MGVWGWDNMGDGVTLQGFVKGHARRSSDDNDWIMDVKPDPTFTKLLTNQDGFTNGDHTIECEVRPPDSLKGEASGTNHAASRHMSNLNEASHAWVRMVGTWVRDRSHSVDGRTIIADPHTLPESPVPGFPDPFTWIGQHVVAGAADAETNWKKGKTEIHPITSIFAEFPPAPDNRSRVVEFFVFSDGKNLDPVRNQAPFPLPHGNENRVATFDVPIPLGTTFTKSHELDLSESGLQVTVVNSTRFTTLHGKVTSGRVSDQKGFYRVTLTLPGFTLRTYLVDRNLDPKPGIRRLMNWAGVKSVRRLFERLDTIQFASSG